MDFVRFGWVGGVGDGWAGMPEGEGVVGGSCFFRDSQNGTYVGKKTI